MSEGRSVEIGLFRSQLDFYQSTATHTAYIGGFGSGKSYVGIQKTIRKKLQYPKHAVAYYLPTYPLINDIAYPKFSEILHEWKIPFVLHRSSKEIYIPHGGKIIFRSMENYEKIIGFEVAYSCIDEADVMNMDKMNKAFVNILARNRSVLPEGHSNITDLVGTPEGFKFAYHKFVKESRSNRRLIKARTMDNTFLSSDYIETLKETYTEQQLDAYLNGEFVNLTTGTVYRNFDRNKNHSNRELKHSDTLHIGMDFNIQNMASVVYVVDNGIPIAVNEHTGVYDTQAMIEILRQYKNVKKMVYPDATGKARKTSSGKSDIQLLKEAGLKVVTTGANPFVRDRVNAMNVSFLNNNGKHNHFVNTYECPNYTEALEQQGYTDNGEPDKTRGFDHILDAGGYFVYQHTKKQFKAIW